MSTLALAELPPELLAKIFSYLEPQKLAPVKLVCRQFFNLARDESFYVKTLDLLRVRFPLVVKREDGLGLNAYQKTMRCAICICRYHAKAVGKVEGTNDALIDVMNIEPHDAMIKKAIESLYDRNLYDLCRMRLSSYPTRIVETFIRTIKARAGKSMVPQYNIDWMRIYALRRYIQEMPKPCVKAMLKSLDHDTIYDLITCLYPLGVDLKIWWEYGLNFELANSEGNSLAHLITRYANRMQLRCGQNDLNEIVSDAVFADPNAFVKSCKENQFLRRVSVLMQNQPDHLLFSVNAVHSTISSLAERFQLPERCNTPELIDVASTYDNLVHTTKDVARYAERKRTRVSNPNKDKDILRCVKKRVLSPRCDRAI